MELNTCLILASSNVPDIATKGPDSDKQTQSPSKQGKQVEVIRS